ncbi:MAG: hypothetical protein J0I09_11610 [Sphingobacteriia bacterium]|nr:hypothetical protein [Sphingobacteriia bacterium]
MKPWYTLFFFLLVGHDFLFCQQLNPDYIYHDNRVNPAFGSAQTLQGKTHIINVFVSDDRKGWSAEDKADMHFKEKEGLGWINWHAKKWGIEGITFSIADLSDKDIKVDKIESTNNLRPKNPLKWVPLVLNLSGVTNIPHFYDSVKEATKADNIVVMIFAKKSSRSYAQPAHSNQKENERFLEGAVVFKNSYYDKETGAATIIHEMLHLFGARDIYPESSMNAELESKMQSVFPNSIMLGTFRDIGSLQIEQLTAWCIGWTNSYYGWYDAFGGKRREGQ